MVAVRTSRQSSEVALLTDEPAGATRVDLEVAGLSAAANTTDAVVVSRQSVEVVVQSGAGASAARVDLEVAALVAGANTTDAVRVSRQSAEVVVSLFISPSATRVDVEVAGLASAPNTTDSVRVSRQTVEAALRRGSAGPVLPITLGADNELFLHDWADEVELSSSYSTDISASPVTGAEARRGLIFKPLRSMKLTWRQSSEEFDAADASRLDRLYVLLRRLSDQECAVPLYPDVRQLDAAYLSTDTTLFFDTTRGRWFEGARVAVVRLNVHGSYESHSLHLIDSLQSDRIVLDSQLGSVTAAGWALVLPMIDCHIVMDAQMELETGCLGAVSLSVEEIAGPSQLPPSKADLPSSAQTHLGIPILDVTPDWSASVRSGRSRAGLSFNSGRARGIAPYADRSRERHELEFTNERPAFWKLVEFFDTRRGRLRSFWHIDHQQLWTVSGLSTNFIDVVPFGDFADFAEELEGGQVGLEMADGTFYVRDAVTVQDVSTNYRITVSPVLPSGLSTADVVRVARARRVRFDSDEMVERWTTAGLASTRFRIIEVLEEGVVNLD